MTISLTSRTISTRSPATVEPGIAESGWTNRDRESPTRLCSLVPEHSCAKACYILTIQLISCSKLRKKSSLSVTWKTRLCYSQLEPKLWRVNFWCHNLLQMSSKLLDLLESFISIKKYTSAKSTSTSSTVSSYNKLTLSAIDPFDIYQNNWSYSISIHLRLELSEYVWLKPCKNSKMN